MTKTEIKWPEVGPEVELEKLKMKHMSYSCIMCRQFSCQEVVQDIVNQSYFSLHDNTKAVRQQKTLEIYHEKV